ncbi:hypothetical protein IMZ48_46540 [Candidatus Bathyarchaeota archaeon]|nr:hypothetical protein [Candidatus Bathyarchaeota archaeon]
MVLILALVIGIFATAYAVNPRTGFPCFRRKAITQSQDGQELRGLGDAAVERIPIVEYRERTQSVRRVTRRHPRTTMPTGELDSSPQAWDISAVRAFCFRWWRSIGRNRGTHSVDCPSCCSICTEMLVDGALLRKLPCGHAFHPRCVDPWLRDLARTCPLWWVLHPAPLLPSPYFFDQEYWD